MTVGSELLNEIERVSAKRERWVTLSNDDPATRSALAIGIMLMTGAIEAAKDAIQSDDPIAAVAALENLKGYDDND